MNKGLVVAIAQSDNLQDMDLSANEPENNEINLLPPDFALIRGLNSEPGSLDKVLRGPNAKEWQTALEYEINQLKKLGTWVVEDLLKEHTAIPCSEVLKIKRCPNGEVQSYWVHIVAGGHRQYLGVIISQNSVKMNPVKIAGVTEWPIPSNRKEVQSFLGFTNFYCRFIQGFSHLAHPLFDLTWKDTEWRWGAEEQSAFDSLKEWITMALIFCLSRQLTTFLD